MYAIIYLEIGKKIIKKVLNNVKEMDIDGDDKNYFITIQIEEMNDFKIESKDYYFIHIEIINKHTNNSISDIRINKGKLIK